MTMTDIIGDICILITYRHCHLVKLNVKSLFYANYFSVYGSFIYYRLLFQLPGAKFR